MYFWLVKDIGDAVEGDLDFVVEADAADEVEELEAEVGEHFEGGEDVVDLEGSDEGGGEEDEEAAEVGDGVGDCLFEGPAHRQRHEVADFAFAEGLDLALEGHFPAVELDEADPLYQLGAQLYPAVLAHRNQHNELLYLLAYL